MPCDQHLGSRSPVASKLTIEIASNASTKQALRKYAFLVPVLEIFHIACTIYCTLKVALNERKNWYVRIAAASWPIVGDVRNDSGCVYGDMLLDMWVRAPNFGKVK